MVFEVTDGRAVLLNAEGSELITLNPTGTAIWQALDGETDASGVATRLVEVFEGTTVDELGADIEGFLAELVRLGLVEPGRAAG